MNQQNEFVLDKQELYLIYIAVAVVVVVVLVIAAEINASDQHKTCKYLPRQIQTAQHNKTFVILSCDILNSSVLDILNHQLSGMMQASHVKTILDKYKSNKSNKCMQQYINKDVFAQACALSFSVSQKLAQPLLALLTFTLCVPGLPSTICLSFFTLVSTLFGICTSLLGDIIYKYWTLAHLLLVILCFATHIRCLRFICNFITWNLPQNRTYIIYYIILALWKHIVLGVSFLSSFLVLTTLLLALGASLLLRHCTYKVFRSRKNNNIITHTLTQQTSEINTIFIFSFV